MTKNTISTPNYLMADVLAQICTKVAPVGTDLGLFQTCASLASGYLRGSRGALIPALETHLQDQKAVSRAHGALYAGQWAPAAFVKATTETLCATFPQLKPVAVAGYTLRPIDMSAIFRPKWAQCQTKHYTSVAGRALAAVPFGLHGPVYETPEGKRVVLPTAFVLAEPLAPSHKAHRTTLLASAVENQQAHELTLTDREFLPSLLLAAGCQGFLTRGRSNLTGSRGEIPPYSGTGRPPTRRPELVRPLPGKWKEKVLPATPPDEVQVFEKHKRTIRAEIYTNVFVRESAGQALEDTLTAEALHRVRNTPLNLIVIYDPAYQTPAIYVTDVLTLQPADIYTMYPCRWPIELIPQTGKTLLGGGTTFVHSQTSSARLPCLLMMMAVLLNVGAACLPPLPTGYWDRKPTGTPGRLAKHLMKVGMPPPSQLSKKNSKTSHLPSVTVSRWEKRTEKP